MDASRAYGHIWPCPDDILFLFFLCWGFTATDWGHVERGQFT